MALVISCATFALMSMCLFFGKYIFFCLNTNLTLRTHFFYIPAGGVSTFTYSPAQFVGYEGTRVCKEVLLL